MTPGTSLPEPTPAPQAGDISHLWEVALEGFYAETDVSLERRSMIEGPPSPETWLASFKKARHPDGTLQSVYQTMCKHIEIVRLSIDALQYAAGIVTTV